MLTRLCDEACISLSQIHSVGFQELCESLKDFSLLSPTLSYTIGLSWCAPNGLKTLICSEAGHAQGRTCFLLNC